MGPKIDRKCWITKKLVEEGRHPSQKKKLCPGCGREISILGYKRWGHGPDCKRDKEEA